MLIILFRFTLLFFVSLPLCFTVIPFLSCYFLSFASILFLCIVAKLTIKEGSQKDFEELMRGLAKEVRANEPGNIIYDLMLKAGSTTEYYVMEQYKDAESMTAHGASAHFRAASPKMGPMLDGRPEIIRMDSKS